MQRPTPDVTAVLNRGLGEALRRTGLPIGFAGLVNPDRRSFVISASRGLQTSSLVNLTVRSGEGLGGRTLAAARPTAVSDYASARGITKRYHREVSPEGLVSVISLPIALPGSPVSAVLYLAERRRTDFGSVLADRLRPVVAELAREIHIESEVARRAAPAAAPAMAPELYAELVDLMGTTTDPRARERLAALLGGTRAGTDDEAAGGEVRLTPRERDVVRGAGEGLSNAAVAHRLGLTEQTVKSYMKGAMAKLGVANRVQAANVARRHGLL
ncbi:DNA-binding CsgD family transcriptional regulator [Nocardioides zeae]|uniref:DNA-binding CsgD family transcriptional regulator n=2 Tax=Nocardioides zeae TaxID=1457234 RepID=A0AAJ1X3U1_9ACTN|nr:LuxR C-terminal-related transcriptional regulator [Nocardioides zeae]MDQ1106774.1 DNA-binding CsgD family transcriptional regulator [Nocardioides zeae]MDR6173571.1 DNA-binding CsgD family transcriptional regulator [Nocardioides zeae]MDR6210976.1 DNA-binding CsgD family transcriptional regulator [Nocardioides zeae]